MKEKGFTLVELLGVIVILSIIMLVAVPNVMSTLENSKRKRYIADAKQFITQAEYALRNDIEKPNSTQLLKITLEDLGTNDIEKDPDGDKYSLTDSYIVVSRADGYLTYYVNLVANKGEGKTKGIGLVHMSNLDEESSLKLIQNDVPRLNDNQIKSTCECNSCTVIPVTR